MIMEKSMENTKMGCMGFRVWVELRVFGKTAGSYYLNPENMYNNGVYGCHSGLKAIMLYTFWVWVQGFQDLSPKPKTL